MESKAFIMNMVGIKLGARIDTIFEHIDTLLLDISRYQAPGLMGPVHGQNQ
jgi:hypothetical protein